MTPGPRGSAELGAIAAGAAKAGAPTLVAFVGAGGKTSSLFALARRLAATGARVLATTTTRMLNPEAGSEREGKGFGPVIELGDSAGPVDAGRVRAAGPLAVLGARGREVGKLYGIAPESIEAIAGLFDYVLIEADGARGLSIKAPAAHEPVVPAGCGVVIGVAGLDAIGSPMDDRVVHRPELFGPLVGCARRETITTLHLLRLVASPRGLFKGAPRGAARVVLLNKTDAVSPELAADCASELRRLGAAVVLGALGARAEGARQ
jgi:probable selenium-dependent hydroxylase accessory protein YqeC